MDSNDPFASVPQIDAKTAYDRWQSGLANLLDVREPYEWDIGHIEGSEWIPMDQLSHRWTELDPHKPWIVLCHSGVRSHYVAAALREAGFDASNLLGGIVEWHSAKLPITPPGIVD